MNGERGTLNIIFHGSFVFLLDKNHKTMEVLIPKIDGHVFRAGNWLAETELKGAPHNGSGGAFVPPPEYTLEGVDAGDATFDPRFNLILKCNKQLKPGYEKLLHAVLKLKQPEKILTPRRSPVDVNTFQTRQGGSAQAELKRILREPYAGFVPTLQLFVYRFSDDSALRLQGRPNGVGHIWEPAFARNTVNLHIFAAEEVEHGLLHVARAFDTCIGLFEDIDLSLPPVPLRGEPLRREELPHGVNLEEYEDLVPRVRRMAQLGWRQKEGRDLSQLWLVDSEAFDSEPNCDSGPCRECG